MRYRGSYALNNLHKNILIDNVISVFFSLITYSKVIGLFKCKKENIKGLGLWEEKHSNTYLKHVIV